MWATPDANSGKRGGTVKRGKRPSGANRQVSINDQVKMWPTPQARDYKDSGPVGSKSYIHMQKKQYLCEAVKDPNQPRGSLNPQWVEWLMGYPEGWTDLKD
jgi:hypothetical protein